MAVSALILVSGVVATSSDSHAQSSYGTLPAFESGNPDSEDTAELRDGLGRLIPGAISLSASFCSEWNPEFSFNGQRCCSKVMRAKGSRRRRRAPPKVCSRDRFKPNFCDELTEDQRAYINDVSTGKISDVLAAIGQDIGRRGEQAYCTVNNGFLAWGRPVLPTLSNRLELRMAERCTNFGTDNMTGMVEWVGQQVSKEYLDEKYAGVKVVVGDISAPRGGCLAGRTGPRGHASHTTGQDVDVGFLTVRSNRESPLEFHNDFDPKTNWWFIKQFFKNPYACVKVVFLDKRDIRKLGKVVRGDEDWDRYRRFIRHSPGHRNHLHVRIGDGPGLAGCTPGANPEDESEEGGNTDESGDLEAVQVSADSVARKPAAVSSTVTTPSQ